MAHVLRRVQALHPRRLPRRVPDRLAVPHRVRHGRRAGGLCNGCGYCVPACPFGVIDQRERRPGLEVHPLLRPAPGRTRAGVRHRLPDGVDPVRAAGRAAGPGRRPGRRAAGGRRRPTPACTAPTPTTASAGWAPSSSSSTSPRSTACPPIRSSPPATCPGCGVGRRRRRHPGRGRRRRLPRPAPPMTPVARLIREVHRPGATARTVRIERAGADVLRAAGPQGAGVEVVHPGLLLHRRARGRVGPPRRRRPAHGRPPAGPPVPAGVVRRRRRQRRRSWSPTSAAPPASSTCCGWPRPRRP